MADDVFISYSSRDRRRAIEVAAGLRAHGWSVWIDRWRLLGGHEYRTEIARALDGCRAAVVLWSSRSVASTWVRAEASRAHERGVIVPARLDDAPLPMPFSELHTLDLSTGGDPRSEEFQALVRSVAARLDEQVPAPPAAATLASARRAVLAELLRALAPPTAAATLLVLLALWCVFRLGVPTPVAFGVPLFLAVVGRLIGSVKEEAALSELLARLCRPAPLAVLTVVTLALSTFTSVVVRVADGEEPAAVRLLSGDAPREALREGVAAPEERWLLFAPPWGRPVVVEADGHAPLAAEVTPWRGLTRELGAHSAWPLVVTRLPVALLSLSDGATLRICVGATTYAEARLGKETGTVVVGGDVDLDAFREEWSADLVTAGVPETVRARALARWSTGLRVDWIDGQPPPRDVDLEARLTTSSGESLPPRKFRLKGAVTDVDP